MEIESTAQPTRCRHDGRRRLQWAVRDMAPGELAEKGQLHRRQITDSSIVGQSARKALGCSKVPQLVFICGHHQVKVLVSTTVPPRGDMPWSVPYAFRTRHGTPVGHCKYGRHIITGCSSARDAWHGLHATLGPWDREGWTTRLRVSERRWPSQRCVPLVEWEGRSSVGPTPSPTDPSPAPRACAIAVRTGPAPAPSTRTALNPDPSTACAP
jgi:hypothetical protein